MLHTISSPAWPCHATATPPSARSRSPRGRGSWPTCPATFIPSQHSVRGLQYEASFFSLAFVPRHSITTCLLGFKHTFTCALGNCDVRSVSCVSSLGRRLGMLRIRADWSMVAAIAVIRYPLSHRLWTPSLGYKKSSSTTCQQLQKTLPECQNSWFGSSLDKVFSIGSKEHLTWSVNPALRDMTMAHRLPDVAIDVT